MKLPCAVSQASPLDTESTIGTRLQSVATRCSTGVRTMPESGGHLMATLGLAPAAGDSRPFMGQYTMEPVTCVSSSIQWRNLQLCWSTGRADGGHSFISQSDTRAGLSRQETSPVAVSWAGVGAGILVTVVGLTVVQ